MDTMTLKQVSWYHYKISVPAVGWDKPAYIVWEGALRAFKFVKVEAEIRNMMKWNDYDAKPVYHLNIAGIGIVQIKGGASCSFCKDFWLSPEDYPSRDGIIKACKEVDDFTIMERLTECFGMDYGQVAHYYKDSIYQATVLKIERYRWDGTKPVVVHLEVPTKMFYTQQRGWHFEQPCKLPEGTFASREECERANEVRVVDFDDDDTEPDDERDEEVERVVDLYNDLNCAQKDEFLRMTGNN